MSKVRFLSILLMAALLLIPLLALAQEDEEEVNPDWIEFETEEGEFTISHPADWYVYHTDGAFIHLINSPELSGQTLTGENTQSVQEGFHRLTLATYPNSMVFGPSFDPADTTIEDLTTFVKLLVLGPALDDETGPVITSIQVVNVSEDFEVGYFTFALPDAPYAAFVFTFAHDDMVTVGHLTTSTGEYSEALQQLVFEIVTTYEVHITAEELETLWQEAPQPEGTAEPEATAEPTSEPAGTAEPGS